jgi:hypothetical protein
LKTPRGSRLTATAVLTTAANQNPGVETQKPHKMIGSAGSLTRPRLYPCHPESEEFNQGGAPEYQSITKSAPPNL